MTPAGLIANFIVIYKENTLDIRATEERYKIYSLHFMHERCQPISVVSASYHRVIWAATNW